MTDNERQEQIIEIPGAWNSNLYQKLEATVASSVLEKKQLPNAQVPDTVTEEATHDHMVFYHFSSQLRRD